MFCIELYKLITSCCTMLTAQTTGNKSSIPSVGIISADPPPAHLVQWQDKMVLNLPKIFLFSCTVCCMLMRCAPTAVWGFHVRFLFRSTIIIIIIQCKQSFRALREAISETVSGAKWNPTKKDVGSGFFTYFELDTNNQI